MSDFFQLPSSMENAFSALQKSVFGGTAASTPKGSTKSKKSTPPKAVSLRKVRTSPPKATYSSSSFSPSNATTTTAKVSNKKTDTLSGSEHAPAYRELYFSPPPPPPPPRRSPHGSVLASQKRNTIPVFREVTVSTSFIGEAEVLLTSTTGSSSSESSSSSSFDQQQQQQRKKVNPKRSMTLKLLRGKDMPVENPCVRISQVEADDDDDDTHHDHLSASDALSIGEATIISVGETVIDEDFRGMAEGNSRYPIWGGPNATWTIHANEETELGFFLFRNVKERNFHLAETKITVGELLRTDEQYPNVWLDFSKSKSHVFSKGQIQVRLNDSAAPSLHPQQTCSKITPGPAIVPQSSYVIRKMALYCCTPVMLNVYDVSNNVKIENLNKYIKATMGAGIFHAAVEVHGKEYSFGGTLRRNSKATGMFGCAPKKCPMHHYRESVYLGDCELSPAHVERILELLRPEWLASSYNLFRKNCCSFSREFAIQLGVGDIPDWVYSLAESAGFIEPYLVTINNRLNRHTATMPTPAAKNKANFNNKTTAPSTSVTTKTTATTTTTAATAVTVPPKTKNRVNRVAGRIIPAPRGKQAVAKNNLKDTNNKNNKTAMMIPPRVSNISIKVAPRRANNATAAPKHKRSKSVEPKAVLTALSSGTTTTTRPAPMRARCKSVDQGTRQQQQQQPQQEDEQTEAEKGEEEMMEVMLLDHAMAARIQRCFRLHYAAKSYRTIRTVASEEC